MLALQDLLRPKLALRLLALAALGSLLFVYVAEYGFGLQPCYLCLWQRGPYFAVLIVAVVALLVRPSEKIIIVLLVLCALAWLAGLGIAVFHSGVERHWWPGTEQCALRPMTDGAVLSLREQLLQTPVARCDQISWTLFGLSMTNWNVLLSLDLFVYTCVVIGLWLSNRQRQKPSV